jgi:hypothetical protein
MAKLLQTNNLEYAYYTIIAMAFAFTATEYAPILLVPFGACLILQRRELFANWSRAKYFKTLALAAALFVGTIFFVWPGAWLKLTLLKNYSEGEFGTKSFAQVWWERGMNSPLEYSLIVVTALLAMTHLKRSPWFLLFLIYALLMFAVTFRITTSAERYISSFLPPLFVVGAALICQYLQRLATALQAAITSLIIFLFFLQGYSHFQSVRASRSQTRPLDQLVNYFRGNYPGEEQILTSQEFLPTLQYYFPEKDFSLTLTVNRILKRWIMSLQNCVVILLTR